MVILNFQHHPSKVHTPTHIMDYTNDTSINSRKGRTIAHLNIRSLLPKLDELGHTMSQNCIDIMTISETWLHQNIENDIIQIPGYKLFRQDRKYVLDNRVVTRGGGLLTYVKREYTVNDQKYFSLNCYDSNVEIQALEITRGHDGKIIILNCYRPPTGNANEGINIIIGKVEQLMDIRYAERYVMGDLNINHMDGNNTDCRTLQGNLNTLGLRQQIQEPTRITFNTSTLLDVIYTDSDKITDKSVLQTSISDHFLVSVTRYRNKEKTLPTTFKGRSYKRYNYEKAVKYFRNIDKNRIYNYTDVNLVWNYIKRIMINCANHLCPQRTIKTQTNDNPWISNEIRELINDRDQWFIEWSNSGNLDTLKEAKRLRTEVKKQIRNAKSEHIKQELETTNGDPKKFWRTINKILKTTGKTSNINELSYNNKHISNKDDMANIINDYFSSVGSNLASNIKQTENYVPLDISSVNIQCDNQFDLVDIDSNTYLKEVRKLNIYKSRGFEHLSTRLVKDFMTILQEEFLFLFNLSLRTGKVPDEWKQATVTPIPKVKGCPSPGDLRPISILPTPIKVLEHIIHDQLHLHLMNENFLSPTQYGFQKNKSTVEPIGDFVD